MATLFENFTKWYPIASQSQAILANIAAKDFSDKEDRARAAFVNREVSIHSGVEKTLAEQQAEVFAKDSDEEEIGNYAKAAKETYEPLVKGFFSGSTFSAFYDSAPKGVQGEAYNLLEHARPKSDLSALTGDMKKAAELHSTFGGLGLKIQRYLQRGVHGSEKTDIEKEVQEKLFEYYDNQFLDTPEKKAMFEKMVEVLKKWAKKKPQRAVAVYHSIYEKNKEEFDKLITKDNSKEYQTLAIDSDELSKLYATANQMYKQSEEKDRARDASGLLPAVAVN